MASSKLLASPKSVVCNSRLDQLYPQIVHLLWDLYKQFRFKLPRNGDVGSWGQACEHSTVPPMARKGMAGGYRE